MAADEPREAGLWSQRTHPVPFTSGNRFSPLPALEAEMGGLYRSQGRRWGDCVLSHQPRLQPLGDCSRQEPTDCGPGNPGQGQGLYARHLGVHHSQAGGPPEVQGSRKPAPPPSRTRKGQGAQFGSKETWQQREKTKGGSGTQDPTGPHRSPKEEVLRH